MRNIKNFIALFFIVMFNNIYSIKKGIFMKKTVLFMVIFLIIFFACTVLFAEDKLIFNSVFDEKNRGFLDVVSAKGFFTAVGANGYIATSHDGMSWTKRYTGMNDEIYKVKIVNGYYFIFYGNGKMSMSDDSVKWWKPRLNETSLNDIAFSNDLYVVVGKNIFTSTDLDTWNKEELNTNIGWLNTVFWNGEEFIAYGQLNATENKIYRTEAYSIDGKEWEVRNITSNYIIHEVKNINGRYFALAQRTAQIAEDKESGQETGKVLLQSSNGKNWHEILEVGETSDVIWDGKQYITNRLFVSKNVVSWEEKVEDFPSRDYIAYNGTSYLGGNGVSRDLSNWVYNNLPEDIKISLVLYDEEKYLLPGDGEIYITDNFKEWQRIKPIKNYMFETMSFINGKYISTAYLPDEDIYCILTSSDGYTWEEVYRKDSKISRIIWDNNNFICVLPDKYLLTSEDALEWTKIEIPAGCEILDIGYNGSQYLLTTSNGIVLLSEDLYKWNIVQLAFKGVIYDPVSNGDVWKIRIDTDMDGSGGDMYESKDGVEWKRIDIAAKNIEFLKYSGGYFICNSKDFTLMSIDSKDWESNDSLRGIMLNDIIWDGENFVAVGNNNVLLSEIRSTVSGALIIVKADFKEKIGKKLGNVYSQTENALSEWEIDEKIDKETNEKEGNIFDVRNIIIVISIIVLLGIAGVVIYYIFNKRKQIRQKDDSSVNQGDDVL